MSIKNKLMTAAVSAFAVAAFSSLTVAQQTGATATAPQPDGQMNGKRDGRGFGGRGHGGRFGKHGGGMMRGFRELNLTDAQREQIRSIMETNRPDDASRQEMRTLAEARRAGTLTADQQERFQTLRQTARVNGENVRQQILAVLTAEQRQQLEQKQVEMRQRWEERRQRRDAQRTPTDSKDN